MQSFNIVVYYYQFHKKSRKCPKFTSSRPPSPLNKNNRTVWQYLKGVLRYFKGNSDLKLVYKRNLENNLEILTGDVDSDWAGDKITRISTTGYLFKLYDKCTICWNTKKQRSVADSSIAAE